MKRYQNLKFVAARLEYLRELEMEDENGISIRELMRKEVRQNDACL